MNLTLTPLDWLVCLDTLGGSVVLGLAMAARLNSGESTANFFLAGRQLTWPVIGRLTLCHQHRGEHLVGLSGDAYRSARAPWS